MSNVAAGKDIDDEGESLNNVETVLNKLNIKLRDSTKQWRNFEDVLDEVADKWSTFADTERSQIATAIAGTRQQETFAAMMNNWKEVERLTKVSADSAGSASKKMEIYLDSVEAKTNNLRAAWEKLVMTLNQSDSYKNFLDMVTNFLDKLSYVDWKEIGTILKLFITLFGIMKTATWITKGVAAIKAAETSIAAISAGMSAFAPQLVIILGLIVAVAVAIKSINDNLDKQIDSINDRIDSINEEKESIEEDKKSVQELYNEYENLKAKQSLMGLDAAERQKMADITKELVEQYGFEYSSIDSLTGGYVLATDALTKYTEAKKEQIKQLDEEERKNKIKKTATYGKKQNKDISTAETVRDLKKTAGWGNEGEFNEAGGFGEKLDLDWNALVAGFTGTGSFEEDYAKYYQDFYKKREKELEDVIEQGWNDITDSLMDTLTPTIENSGLSDRFTSLLTTQIKTGIKNIDLSKLDEDKEVEELVSSYERILADSGLKTYSEQIDKTLTSFEQKIANKAEKMTLNDYKDYNKALEQQAGMSISLLDNIVGRQKAIEIASESLQEQLSNTGSYFALLSDQVKKDFDSSVSEKFDNIANSIININQQLANGQIDIKNYFNLMKNEIDSIDLSHIEDSFGNIGNYLATMGQISNAGGGQLQSIITDMQQGKTLNNEGVDKIKTVFDLLGTVSNNIERAVTDENGNYKTYQDKNGNDYNFQKLFNDTYTTELTDDAQRKVTALKSELTSLQKQEELVSKGIGENAAKEIIDATKAGVSQTPTNKAPSAESLNITGIYSGNKQVGTNHNKELEDEETSQKSINKLKEKEAKIQEEINSLTDEQNKETHKVERGIKSNMAEMEQGVKYLDSFDWDKLDKASDTIFQGFADGAFNANSTIDNVAENYKNAALEMSNAFIDMFQNVDGALGTLSESMQSTMKSIGKETLAQIGLTSDASTEEIANAMLSSQANFNAVVAAMNKGAQEALQSVLEGAGGMLEALGTAIENFTGEIKISIGGVQFNGLKSFLSWDEAPLFSSASAPVETSIKFSGSGIDTGSLGQAIKSAGTALKENAGTLASQWTPIQPNLTTTNKKGGNGNSGGSGGGGSGKKGSGSDNNYSADDAAEDLKSILNDIEKYEKDIETDLEDQTEELLNEYNLERNKLDLLKEELDYYDSIYDAVENTSKWLDNQLKVLDEESKKVAEMQNANEKIDKQRQKIYKENSKYNVQSWFDEAGNETLAYGNLLNSFEYQIEAIQKETAAKMRNVYNGVSGSTNKDTISDAKKQIKNIEEEADNRIKALEKEKSKVENIYDSASKLNDAWKENQEAIRDALAEMNDRVKSIRDELVDQMMTQLERATDRMNTSIEKDVTRLEQLKQVQESYNDILNDTIDTQQELEDELRANMDTYQYLDDTMRQLMFNEDDYKQLSGVLAGIQQDITDIWEDHYNQIQSLTEDEMYKAEYITSETERQLAAKQKEYDLAKAELDVAKAQTNLNNVLNERDTRLFVNGQWQWVANPENVKNARQQLADVEREKDRIEREAEQQKLIDNLDQIIDSDNLQIDKNNDLLEKIQEAIEQETEEVKSIEEALLNTSKANLPALNTLLHNALGDDGGYMKELLGEINHSQVELAAALRGQTIQQATDQLKSGTLSKSAFNELVKRLGFSFNETTGVVTTQDGSFAAHYAGWTKKANTGSSTTTAANGVQVTGGSSGGSGSGGSGGGGSAQGGFPRTGHVSTSSLPLRIRSGAGTNYKVLGTMPRGASVTVTGEVNGEWAKVSYNGINGYASRQYLTYDQGGLAEGLGLLPKATIKPERVLSPRQTKAFENLISNLTTNPILNALSKVPQIASNFDGLESSTDNSKKYFFSNFTVQADDIEQFINSIETMIPMKK